MKFHAIIQLSGKTATGIQVPDEVVASLGSGKRPSVRVTINGHMYRSTVAVLGGQFMLPVSADVRKSASVAAGDEVDVEIEIDTEPREVNLPPDFREALDRDISAGQFFETLSFSQKQRFVILIEGAKTSETRQRRIDQSIIKLRAGQV
jgi:hypothetical protein